MADVEHDNRGGTYVFHDRYRPAFVNSDGMSRPACDGYFSWPTGWRECGLTPGHTGDHNEGDGVTWIRVGPNGLGHDNYRGPSVGIYAHHRLDPSGAAFLESRAEVEAVIEALRRSADAAWGPA